MLFGGHEQTQRLSYVTPQQQNCQKHFILSMLQRILTCLGWILTKPHSATQAEPQQPHTPKSVTVLVQLEGEGSLPLNDTQMNALKQQNTSQQIKSSLLWYPLRL